MSLPTPERKMAKEMKRKERRKRINYFVTSMKEQRRRLLKGGLRIKV